MLFRSKAILQAVENPTGFHNLRLYKGNVHDYEILITQNISEIEWQNMPNDSEHIVFIKEYNELVNSLKSTEK